MRRDPGGSGGPTGVARRPGRPALHSAHPDERRRRRHDERGALTAEAALVVPFLVLVTLALVWTISLVGLRLQAVDASREAARLAARGEPAGVVTGAARASAPGSSMVAVTVEGDQVRVRVEIPAVSGLPSGPVRRVLGAFSGLRVSAESVAALERVP